MVRVRGLEPPPNCFDMNLNHTRLPIPPYPHILFVGTHPTGAIVAHRAWFVKHFAAKNAVSEK